MSDLSAAGADRATTAADPSALDRFGGQIGASPTRNRDKLQHSAPTMAAHEVASAFFANSRPLSEKQRAHLHRRGVADEAIERDFVRPGGPIRAARVAFGSAWFDFAEAEATDAFVVIARNELGVASDIVAFHGAVPVSRWIGREPMLGADLVLAPRLGAPLRLYPNVPAWLCGSREGIVVFDWPKAAHRLDGVSLVVATKEFANLAFNRLKREPEIYVEAER